MAKAFHGRIEDTRDALIILEACRQGLLPRINRRLLAAEREGIVKAESYDESSSGPATRTRQATTANPSLIEAGSVFVFDEDESRICRWTDGKIWSPSRICGNFLVYRELYRKLPEQKCWTAKDKASMKDGNGLKDKTLKETVKKENLVVLGCMKGTFVLKKDGLIKKTICVTGVELLSPEELRGRGNVASRLRTGKGAASNRPPGLKLAGIQHLVCYERPGAAMKSLHRPREYVQLRDLPISKTFVLTQKYRNPLQITPLPPDQLPIDAWDEYINSERIAESRNPSDSQVRPKPAKPSLDDDSGTTSSNDFMSDEYVHHFSTEQATAETSTSHKGSTASHPYRTRSHSNQPSNHRGSQVNPRITRSSARPLRRSTRLTAPMDSHSEDFSSQRKRRSTSVTSNEHLVFVKDEEFASAPSTNTLVHDTQNWTSNSPTDSQLEVHGVKSKDGQWELLPFSTDVHGHMEAASGALLPSTSNHDGLHDGRALTDYEEEETSRKAAWMAEQAGTPVQTPSHGRLRQHDRNVSLSPAMPWTLTNHPGELPGTRPKASEDWTPFGTSSPNDNSKGHMLVPTPNASSEHEEFTSNPTLPSMLIGSEVSLGTNEPSLVAKLTFHEYSPSTISSSFHSERSCGLSLSSSLSLSPAGNSSSTNSPSTLRSPRSNILRRSESKTPLSPMYEHDEVEDSAVTSAAMILTSALSENQLSQKTLYHPIPEEGAIHSAASPSTPYPPISPLLSQAEWRGPSAPTDSSKSSSENFVLSSIAQHASAPPSSYALPPVMHMAQYGTPFGQPNSLQQYLSGSVIPTAASTAIPSWSLSPIPTIHQAQHLSHERPPPSGISFLNTANERELQQYHLQQPLQQPQQQMRLDSQMQSQFIPTQPFSDARLVSGFQAMHPEIHRTRFAQMFSGGTNYDERMRGPFEEQHPMSLASCRSHGLALQGDHASVQASEESLKHRMNWNQTQAIFRSSPTSPTCNHSTAPACAQTHGSSPASSGLTYDSSASFTSTGDEARAQQRRYMSPSNYLFPRAASSASLDHSQVSDASSSVRTLRPQPRFTTCSRETDSVSYQPSFTPSRQSSAYPTSTDSEGRKNRRKSPASDVHPCNPGEIYQEEHFNRCGGDGLGYVFDQEPLGAVEVTFYSSGTRDPSFVGSTQPDLEAITSFRASQFTPGTLSAMHPSATDDSARSSDDLEVSADESLGKAEYLLHPQHSRLSQFSQPPSDPSSEARQDRRSDRFSDENQPWALRRHEDAAQDMFPGLMDLRPRSSAHESSASENPHLGGALEQEEFLEDRLERARLARAMEVLDDDDMSSKSELTDGTRSDDTGLLYSPTPA